MSPKLRTDSYGRAALRTCVRQNRVVLAVVATVKLLRRRHSRQPARCPRISRGRGRPEGIRLPGEHGISRQTTAQGRPSDWLHLYAAVQSFCATCAQRTVGASRHPAFPAPSFLEGATERWLGRNPPRECEGVSVATHSMSSPAKAGDPVFQRRL